MGLNGLRNMAWIQKSRDSNKKSAARHVTKSVTGAGLQFLNFSQAQTEIKKGIKQKASTEELREMAMENGMRTLRMDAVEKVFQGCYRP